MKKLILAIALWLLASPAFAQNPTCPTRPTGDSTNACASTAFVHNVAGTIINQSSINLTAATTFYLNGDAVNPQPCGAQTCAAGSDANNCLTISTPCKTIQHTLNFVAATYNFAGQQVAVQTSKGTYNECVLTPPYLTTNPTDKNVFIQGNATVSDVTVNCASGNAFTAVNSPQGWVIKNITLAASNVCAFADYNGKLFFDGVNFSGCTNIDVQAANNGAFAEFVNNPYTASDSAFCHIDVVNGGEVTWNGVTANFVGTPTYSLGLFCSLRNYGIIDDALLTISGAFSGPKFNLVGPPIVFSSGVTATTAGTTQFIGQGSVSSTENNYFTIASGASGLVDLYVNTTQPPSAGHTYVFTVRIGGNDTALTCTISNTATACADQNHLGFGGSGQIAAGQVIDLKIVSSAGANTTQVSASAVPHN